VESSKMSVKWYNVKLINLLGGNRDALHIAPVVLTGPIVHQRIKSQRNRAMHG